MPAAAAGGSAHSCCCCRAWIKLGAFGDKREQREEVAAGRGGGGKRRRWRAGRQRRWLPLGLGSQHDQVTASLLTHFLHCRSIAATSLGAFVRASTLKDCVCAGVCACVQRGTRVPRARLYPGCPGAPLRQLPALSSLLSAPL